MKITRKKAILTLTIVLAVVALSVAAVLLTKPKESSQQNSNQSIRGEVVGGIERPNDEGVGHKSYAIRTDNGTNYQIDVTGYMYSDLKPEDFGEACIDVPELATGDKVEFKLPLIEGTEDTYKVCYEKDSGEYYLTKL